MIEELLHRITWPFDFSQFSDHKGKRHYMVTWKARKPPHRWKMISRHTFADALETMLKEETHVDEPQPQP